MLLNQNVFVFLHLFYQIFLNMFDFYEVTFEAKIRQNIGQICETIKIKDMPRLVTMEATYSKDISSRVSSTLIILTHCQKECCISKM